MQKITECIHANPKEANFSNQKSKSIKFIYKIYIKKHLYLLI